MRKRKLLSLITAMVLTLCLVGTIPFQAKQTASANEIDVETVEELVSLEEPGYEVSFSYMDILEVYYENVIEYSEHLNVEVDDNLKLEDFYNAYYSQDTYLISEYVDYLENIIEEKAKNNSNLMISDLEINSGIMLLEETADWWEGAGGQELPQQPNYEGWLYELKPGDIIYEQGWESTNLGIELGHVAIVHGLAVDFEYGDYWAVLESVNPSGVVCGVIDNDRFVKYKSIVLSVDSATTAQRENAVRFCWNEFSKPYAAQLTKATSADAWMCSTLIWAAYNNSGIDLCPNVGTYEIVKPIDFFNSSFTSVAPFMEYEYLQFQVIKKYDYLFVYHSWDIMITNPNDFLVRGLYNARLCFDTHALKFDEQNLSHETDLVIAANASEPVFIRHNGTAGYATACYKFTIGSVTYKMTTCANNLKVGSCKMYYSLTVV